MFESRDPRWLPAPSWTADFAFRVFDESCMFTVFDVSDGVFMIKFLVTYRKRDENVKSIIPITMVLAKRKNKWKF